MKVRETVFGSRSEQSLFRSLEGRWAGEFDLWPQLPLSSIIELDKHSGFLKPKELDYFYKATIDYTLCTKAGRPILSIEFDGMGKGFSRNGEYVQVQQSHDANRKRKLDLKLKASKNVDYPFFVISFDESKELDRQISLTIVDGIIGQVIAKTDFERRVQDAAEELRDTVECLSNEERRARMLNAAGWAETEAELTWDPIARLASRLHSEVVKKGIASSHSEEGMTDPRLPEIDWLDQSAMDARDEAMKHAVRFGCRVVIPTPGIVIMETVWVRNFGGSVVSPLHIAFNIAKMLAFKRALDLWQ